MHFLSKKCENAKKCEIAYYLILQYEFFQTFILCLRKSVADQILCMEFVITAGEKLVGECNNSTLGLIPA